MSTAAAIPIGTLPAASSRCCSSKHSHDGPAASSLSLVESIGVKAGWLAGPGPGPGPEAGARPGPGPQREATLPSNAERHRTNVRGSPSPPPYLPFLAVAYPTVRGAVHIMMIQRQSYDPCAPTSGPRECPLGSEGEALANHCGKQGVPGTGNKEQGGQSKSRIRQLGANTVQQMFVPWQKTKSLLSYRHAPSLLDATRMACEWPANGLPPPFVFVGSGGESLTSSLRWSPNPAEGEKAKRLPQFPARFSLFDPVLLFRV